MTLVPPPQRPTLDAGARLLGIDLGSHHVGVALFDDPELPARPLETVEVTEKTLLVALLRVAREQRATGLIVGLPLRLDGREGLASRKARLVAEQLRARSGLPVALQDERLTTAQAHGNRIAAGVKDREGIDARAACILLQTWIDTQRRRKRPKGEQE